MYMARCYFHFAANKYNGEAALISIIEVKHSSVSNSVKNSLFACSIHMYFIRNQEHAAVCVFLCLQP